jgi:MFS family permease
VTEEASEPSIGYVALLRENRDFRRLWLAEVISFLGDWFNTIALFTAVAELSGRTEAIALVFVAKMFPIFLMTPLAGTLIDRFDRKKLMVFSDIARSVCAIGLVVAYRQHSLWLLVALIFVMVCFGGLFIPAKSSVLPQITKPGELGAANALSAGTWSVMLALGAALGGFVTGVVGIETALVLDAFTFLLSAWFLRPLPELRAQPDDGAVRDRSFLAGVRYLWQHPPLAATIAIKPMMALAGGGIAMLPVFGTKVFAGYTGPMWMGLLYCGRGFGALVGSLVIRRIFGDAPRTMRRLVPLGFLVSGLAYLSLSQAGTIWHAAASYFGTTVGGGMLWTFSSTLGQSESDNEFRGRVFAIEFGGLTLTMSVMAGVAGMLVDRGGWTVRDVAAASGTLMFIPVVLMTLVALARERGARRLSASSG